MIIAQYDTIIFERDCNWFNELSYIVQDVITDTFKAFEFSRWDTIQERQAYTEATKMYNSLVPDFECIPLF